MKIGIVLRDLHQHSDLLQQRHVSLCAEPEGLPRRVRIVLL